MFRQTFFLALLAGAFIAPFFAVPARAQAQMTLSKSDEDFLSEMPVEAFPGADYMQDKDGDGIADGEQRAGIAAPASSSGGTTPQDSVQYVYKPGSDTELDRLIRDPRIEDGYAQELLRGRGPR